MKTHLYFLLSLLALSFSARAQKPIRIVFNVNVTGYEVAAGGMHVAGQFATDGSTSITSDWNPGDAMSEMIPTGNGRYTLRVTFLPTAAGLPLQFQFVRNNIWWDGNDYSEGTPGVTHLNYSCGVDDGGGGFNRIITIPSYDAVFSANFEHCGKLVKMTMKEEQSNDGMVTLNAYPNPASDRITIDGLNEDAFARISNLLGQVVWSGNLGAASPQINVSPLQPGNYFLSVDGMQPIRFSVER